MPAQRHAGRRRADRRQGAHGRADGRPADAQRHRLRRPAGSPARRAPACSRAASSSSAAARALTLPQSAVLLRDGFSYVLRVGADSKVAQTKVDGRPARRRPHRDHRRAGRRTRAWSPRAAASSATATRCAWSRPAPAAAPAPAAPRSPSKEPSMRDERLRLVDPQPDPGDPAVRHAHAGGPAGLPGDEGAALPGHRPADRHRHRLAARRLAGAAGDRGRAQDRELARHAAGRQAHLHQGAGRHGHASRSSSAWRSRRRRRWTTCATRCRACAPTCRPTCATR